MTPEKLKARDAADYVYNGVIAMCRMGVSLSAMGKSDPKIREYASRSLIDWTKEYLNELQSLAETGLKPEAVGGVVGLYTPNGPYSPGELDVQKAMLPVLQKHLTEFKETRRAPVGYTNHIYVCIQTVTNSDHRAPEARTEAARTESTPVALGLPRRKPGP